MKKTDHCHSCETETKIISLNRNLKLTLLALIATFIISYLPGLEKLNTSFISYFSLIWWAILLGLFIGGLIEYFVPDDFVFKYLGSKKRSSLFFAVIAGFLMSACSHGILAISMQLYKKGASIPAVITFLLASPWANLPITILLFSFFGPRALLFILAAMVIALTTGSVFMILEKLKLIEPSKTQKKVDKIHWHNLKHFNFQNSLKGTALGFINLANMVLWWIIIGFLIAVLIRAYVPHHIFLKFFNPSFLGLLATLLAATIIEICSEGSAPIAFEVFNQVGKLGNPFVFLMAGVVTDYTEIGLIWTNIGRKTAIWLPIITVPQVILTGFLFNLLL